MMDLIKQPFAWGLGLGLLFFALCLYSLLKSKAEFRRYKKMLSDKMELEAEQATQLKSERASLEKENENLRVRLAQLGEKPDAKIARDLEIFARAEKSMMINAPGFAPAWETAKSAAAEELAEEESGKSLPKRLFRRLFGAGVKDVEALPAPETEGERSGV